MLVLVNTSIVWVRSTAERNYIDKNHHHSAQRLLSREASLAPMCRFLALALGACLVLGQLCIYSIDVACVAGGMANVQTLDLQAIPMDLGVEK